MQQPPAEPTSAPRPNLTHVLSEVAAGKTVAEIQVLSESRRAEGSLRFNFCEISIL